MTPKFSFLEFNISLSYTYSVHKWYMDRAEADDKMAAIWKVVHKYNV